MVKIIWTKESEIWLKDIFDYIALENKRAAVGVVEGIYSKVQVLKNFPESGYRYEAILDKEVRILLYGHYRIAYWIKSEKEVIVLGVFHGSLNIQQYLF